MSAEVPAGAPPVLIAEDDPSIGRLLMTLLERSGFAAELARDGQEAIARIREHEYAVILLDLNMPYVDGFGVLDFLATRKSVPRPIVLILTAFDDRIVQALDPEVVSGVLRKPFEVTSVTDRVAECVAAYQAMVRESDQRLAAPLLPSFAEPSASGKRKGRRSS